MIVHGRCALRRALQRALAGREYEVRMAADPVSALEVFPDWSAEVVLCEFPVTSPAIDFWPWLKKQSQAQIIALLGRQPGGLRVESLELGADDYLVSPVQVAEVLARVRLALRRVRMSPVGAATRIETAHLNIDLAGRRVRAGGHDVHLTVTEFELLRCLASQRDQVLPHAHLLDAVWGAKNMSRPQSLRVFIRQLRKKIEPDPDRPRYIITEPGIGYRFQLSTPAAP